MKPLESCVECQVPFLLVDRFGDSSTCVDCANKMRPSIFGECQECRRMIQVGELFHLRWGKLCRPCANLLSKPHGDEYLCNVLATVPLRAER